MKFSEILEGYMEAQQKFLRQRETYRTIPANQRNENMSNDQTTTNMPVINGDGFDQTDADDRIIQGTILRCVDGKWSADGGDLPTGTKMLALGTVQCLQRWEDKVPAETIRKKGNEPLPDVDELNAKVPQEEWETGLNGEPRPPWQKQYVIYLVSPTDGGTFTYINGTFGARIAFDRLKSKVVLMRQLRGANVVPVVVLDAKPMKTKFGQKMRPEFTVVEWCQLGGGSPARIAHDSEAGLQPVEPVPIAEEMNDGIPDL
jgi:hypothetical protein